MPPRSRSLERKTATPASPLARSSLHANSAAQRHQPKRKTAKDTGPSAAVVQMVGERDNWQCFRCGTSCTGERGRDWSVQHRRARGMGGTNRPDTNLPQNLILLCGSASTGCHGQVEMRSRGDADHGWSIKQSANPLRIPVLHWRHGLVFLDAGGRLLCPNDHTEPEVGP